MSYESAIQIIDYQIFMEITIFFDCQVVKQNHETKFRYKL